MGGVATPFQGGFIPPGAPGSPEAGGAPPQQGQQQQPDMGALLGQSQPGPEAPDPQEHLKAIMVQYRKAEQLVEALTAASGPETAPFARKIKDLLREMMKKAVERPGATTEPPAPMTMG